MIKSNRNIGDLEQNEKKVGHLNEDIRTLRQNPTYSFLFRRIQFPDNRPTGYIKNWSPQNYSRANYCKLTELCANND